VIETAILVALIGLLSAAINIIGTLYFSDRRERRKLRHDQERAEQTDVIELYKLQLEQQDARHAQEREVWQSETLYWRARFFDELSKRGNAIEVGREAMDALETLAPGTPAHAEAAAGASPSRQPARSRRAPGGGTPVSQSGP
jgi:hypothetical protein